MRLRCDRIALFPGSYRIDRFQTVHLRVTDHRRERCVPHGYGSVELSTFLRSVESLTGTRKGETGEQAKAAAKLVFGTALLFFVGGRCLAA